jgi:hypothetical protein
MKRNNVMKFFDFMVYMGSAFVFCAAIFSVAHQRYWWAAICLIVGFINILMIDWWG